MICYIYIAFIRLFCEYLWWPFRQPNNSLWVSVLILLFPCTSTARYNTVYILYSHTWFSRQVTLHAPGTVFGHVWDCVSKFSVCVSFLWVSFSDQDCEMKPTDETLLLSEGITKQTLALTWVIFSLGD